MVKCLNYDLYDLFDLQDAFAGPGLNWDLRKAFAIKPG
jgi:hypothetical protein